MTPISSLSDSELLQTLAPRGGDILRDCGSLSAVVREEPEALTTYTTPLGSRRIAAAAELGVRIARERATQTPLDSPELVYAALAPQMAHLPCESLRVALLDTRLRATRFITISDGSVSETIAHPRDILHPAVLHRAHGFLLVHNHPSGDPSPSRADRELTRRIADAAALLQINLLDHLIIGRPSALHDTYFSFREAGLL